MRKWMLLSVCIALTAAGCGYFSQFDNRENARKLRVGMTVEQVREIMGEPLQVSFARPDVWYYYIETAWHDGQTTIDECMPVVFKDGKVAGWGNEYYNRERLLKLEYERPEIEGLTKTAPKP